MKKLFIVMNVLVMVFLTTALLAQDQNRRRNLWPETLETITVTGTVMIDSIGQHPVYQLDVNADGAVDYRLAFGPWWYRPESGAVRPSAGQSVTIVGQVLTNTEPATIIVFELNGLLWREAVQYGRYGWNGEPFWPQRRDTVTVSGWTLIDTTYYYPHYFLDVNNDSIPEYKLGFGPFWYVPASGAIRPAAGEFIIILGLLHEMNGIDLLSVLSINGLEWRPIARPAPWAGQWHRHSRRDTTRLQCQNDLGHWIDFPPGFMEPPMAGKQWPDSVFIQFCRIYPDSLPGSSRTRNQFVGFYLDLNDPEGRQMMNGDFGGHRGRIQFRKQARFHFVYSDSLLNSLGLESSLKVQYWDDPSNQWLVVENASVTTANNSITFSSDVLSNYYALCAETEVTDVATLGQNIRPEQFQLYQNYPNPFNPATSIQFELPVEANLRLAIYNSLGQQVALLVDGPVAAGKHTIQWSGNDASGQPVASGFYLVRLVTGDQVLTRSMVLIK